MQEEVETPARPQPAGEERYERPRQSLSVRIGRKLRRPVNGFLEGQSLVGNDPVLPADILPQLAPLVPQWQDFRREAEDLLRQRQSVPAFGKISPDHRRIASDGKWKSLFLTGYGYRAEKNHAQVPRISAAIEGMDGLVTAFLSIMEPGIHVPSHRGLTKGWLNCHLPLVLPRGEGQCAIEIAGRTYHWREGEWLVFDETFVQKVWNTTKEPRVVLFLQVRRPMRWPGRLLSGLIYRMIRRSRFVQDVRKRL